MLLLLGVKFYVTWVIGEVFVVEVGQEFVMLYIHQQEYSMDDAVDDDVGEG